MNPTRKILFLVSIIISILSYLFILFAVNTELIYDHQQIAWERSSEFFKTYFSFAGGPAEYITLFITQSFYFNWLGSFIVLGIANLISFFLYESAKKKYGISNIAYFLIPLMPVIIVSLMSDYNYHFSITVNLLLIALVIYLCTLFERFNSTKISYHILISGLFVYYFSGGIYFLIFMLASLILMLKTLDRKTWINFLIIVVTAGIIPYLANRFVFLTSLKMSYFRAYPEVAVMLRYNRPILFYVILGMIPLVFFCSAVIYRPFHKSKPGSPLKDSDINNTSRILGLTGSPYLGTIIGVVVLLGLSSFILYKSINPQEKVKNEIEYKAHLGEWEEVISLGNNMKEYDRMVNFQYNRALMHTDKLLDSLYNFEQLLGAQGLFLDIPFTGEVALPNSDLYFDLGNIDESQRLAFEAQTLMPYSPRVLERLALNSIIMGKTDAANTFLNVLSKNPLEKNWVMMNRSLLDNPANLQTDPVIFQKINFMDKAEGLTLTPRDKMISLLQHNPANKNAFEYLIAFDLMIHDLKSFTEDMNYISNYNYTKLPRVTEEAVILFLTQRPDNNVLKGFRVSSETIERFKKFVSITRANRGNREKAKLAAIEFKNTYWYYVLFLSPLVTNITLETRPAETNY